MSKPLKSRATYWGGHILRPIHGNGEDGLIQIVDNVLIFNKSGGLFTKGWNFEMPFDKIIWSEVSQENGQDIAYQQSRTAYAHLAGYGPISSFNRQITYFIVPYTDEKSVKHKPRFTINDKRFQEEFSKIIYEKISTK